MSASTHWSKIFVNMKTTVVIPAYNAEEYLATTIASVVRQTHQDWELIVVNDGSSDSTGSIAEEFALADIRIRVCHQNNLGVAAARNNGVSKADPQVEYFLFLDADDVLEDNALDVLVNALVTNKTALAVHGLSRFIDNFGKSHQEGVAEGYGRNRKGIVKGRLVSHPLQIPTSFFMLVYLNVIHTPGQVLVRKTTLDAVGLFDTDVSPTEDWDMWLRITQIGDIATADNVVLNYRRHASNTSSKDKVMQAAEIALRRKLLKSKNLTPEQRQIALVGYRHSQRYFSGQWLKLAQSRFSKGHLIFGVKLLRRAGIHYMRSIVGLSA